MWLIHREWSETKTAILLGEEAGDQKKDQTNCANKTKDNMMRRRTVKEQKTNKQTNKQNS